MNILGVKTIIYSSGGGHLVKTKLRDYVPDFHSRGSYYIEELKQELQEAEQKDVKRKRKRKRK